MSATATCGETGLPISALSVIVSTLPYQIQTPNTELTTALSTHTTAAAEKKPKVKTETQAAGIALLREAMSTILALNDAAEIKHFL